MAAPSLAQGGEQVILVEFADYLAFMDDITHIDGELLDNAAGFALDFDLSDGLDPTRGDHGPGEINTLHFGKLFGIDLDRLVVERLDGEKAGSGEDEEGQGDPEYALAFPGSHSG